MLEFRIGPANAGHWDRTQWVMSDENESGYLIYAQITDPMEDGFQLGSALLGAVGSSLTLIKYNINEWSDEQGFIDLIMDQAESFMNDKFNSSKQTELLTTDMNNSNDAAQASAA